jgi:hypothetical protein
MQVRFRLLTPVAVLAALVLAGCAAEEDGAVSSATKTHTAASTAKKDKIKYKTVRVRKVIPFSRDIVKTSMLDEGVTRIDHEGRPGVRVRVMRVASKDGVEVGRDLVKTFVKQAPSAKVTLVGTRVKPQPKPRPKPASSSCDPNYAGACVPIASDVDCAGRSGDGPEYVQGPVRVTGDDVYDLNRDDDDIACDS